MKSYFTVNKKYNNDKKRVAIVYNYIHHYRVPIFSLLSQQTDIEYTIYSGTESEISIKKANKKLSIISPSDGGIRWVFLTNLWFFKFILFQKQIIKPSFFFKFDTIIYLGNMYYISTWISALISRLLRKKVIFWTHGYIKEEKNFKGFLRKIFFKIADEILVYGQRAKDILISKGFEKDNIKLIYNSLDFELQRELLPSKKSELNLFKNNNLSIIGFIGRLTKQKKIFQLIEVLNNLKNKNRFNLLIIGDGDEFSNLKKIVESYNLSEYVLFRGSIYDEQINCDLISSMDLLVSPGEVGLTAIHSMTYGTPVITHNKFDKQMPEYEVIVPGLTGDFFDYSNPIESMSSLIPKYYNKREKYSKNCKNTISSNYNPHKQLLIFNKVVI